MNNLHDSPELNDYPYWYFVISFSNYDGDSINIIAYKTWDFGFEEKVSKFSPINVRLYGIDTPELRGGTVESKAAGKLAKDKVWNWLNRLWDLDRLVFESQEYKKGKFGRALGDFRDIETGASLNKYLLENRLAVKYHGQSKDDIKQFHQNNLDYLLSENKLTDYLP